MNMGCKWMGSVVLITHFASATSAQPTLQPGGEYGRGDPLFIYNGQTGRLMLDANGGQDIGLYQIRSQNGIFTGPRPPVLCDCFYEIDTAFELAKVAFTPRPVIDLFERPKKGLPSSFLLDDISGFVSGGFGQTNRAISLLCVDCLEVDDIPPVAENPLLTVLPGERVSQLLVVTDNYAPRSELHWSDLVFLAGPDAPVLDASISDFGRLDWNTQGSIHGEYSWQATVADAVGNQASALIRVRVMPEPSCECLFCFALSGKRFFRHRG